MKTMEESGYVDGYTDEESGETGVEIYGRDVIHLNGKVTSKTPLLTTAQDFAGAINELFQSGTGGGDDIVSVIRSGSTLTVHTVSGRGTENPVIKANSYTLSIQTICRITITTSGSTTITRKWSAEFITAVSNAAGILYQAEYSSDGKLSKVYKSNGNEIYIADLPETLSGEASLETVPDGVALGYMVAYNKMAEEILEKEIESYKDGTTDGTSEGGETPTVTADDVVIPDGSAMAIYDDGDFRDIYYGDSSGEITSVSEDGISFYLHYSCKYSYFRGELSHVNYDNSVAADKYFNNDKWTLTGDWYYRNTGEKYEGEGVSPFK